MIASRPSVASGLLALAALAAGCAHGPLSRDAWHQRVASFARDPAAPASSSLGKTDGTHNASQTERRKLEIRENLERGNAEAAAGRPGQAARFYERVIRDDPGNAVAHHRLGLLADQAGDYSAAERNYLAALEADAKNVDILADLGHSYLRQRRYAESARVLREGIAIDPGHEAARTNLAALSATDDGEGAEGVLHLVAAGEPDSVAPTGAVEPRAVATDARTHVRRLGLIEPGHAYGRESEAAAAISSSRPSSADSAAVRLQEGIGPRNLARAKGEASAAPPPTGLPFWTPVATKTEAPPSTRAMTSHPPAAALRRDPAVSSTSGAVSDLFAKPVPAAATGYSAANVVP